MKTETIKWKNIEVPISKIKPTPNNFKIKSEEGTKRFETSVSNYGLAGAVILNSDFTLIDGNTRVDKARELGHTKIWASMPNRKLLWQEFQEFVAMYDLARAGDVDLIEIKKQLGATKDFFKRWGIEIPEEALSRLDEMEKNENVISPTEKVVKGVQVTQDTTLQPISLIFTTQEAARYIKMAEGLYERFGVFNVTELSMEILKSIKP